MRDGRLESIKRNFQLPSLFDGLRKVGPDKYRGPCPLHGGDNVNGFGVDKKDDLWGWTCFTGDCGSGDAISAWRRMNRGTFLDALEALGGPAAGNPVRPPDGRQLPVTRTPGLMLVCDNCGDETLSVEPRTYGNGTTRPLYESSAYMEALTSGWEIAAGGVACIGPNCIDRSISPDKDPFPRANEYA